MRAALLVLPLTSALPLKASTLSIVLGIYALASGWIARQIDTQWTLREFAITIERQLKWDEDKNLQSQDHGFLHNKLLSSI